MIDQLKADVPDIPGMVLDIKQNTDNEFAGPCPLGELCAAMAKDNLYPREIVTSNKWERFSVEGDKSGETSGFYSFDDNPRFPKAFYGNWKTGLKKRWTLKKAQDMSSAQRTEYTRYMAEMGKKYKEEKKRRAEAAQQRAVKIWYAARPASNNLPYLKQKGIVSYDLKQSQTGQVIVPIYDVTGKLCSLQFINPDGSKKFLSGGAITGNCFTIHGNSEFHICEGYATGASDHAATGATVIVAFNAGNLKPVAKAIRKKHPDKPITICGDNDQWKKVNTGVEAAVETAVAIGARYVVPEFKDIPDGAKPTDFNDLAGLEGPKAVKDQIEAAAKVETGGAGIIIDDDRPTHLKFARSVIDEFGLENILHDDAYFWTWDDSGVWRKVNDRKIKQSIHQVAGWYHKLTRSLIGSILDMVGTETFKDRHEFDVYRRSINCLNGELHRDDDRNEWILKPHNREHYRTTQIPVDYDPNATATRFIDFLHEVFADDPDRIEKAALVCEMIGYSLLSTCEFEKFALLIGPGANGKSVLLDVIRALIGPRNIAAVQPSQFENRFQRAHLHCKLVNLVTEIAQGHEMADAQLKSIVSGELTTAEHKHKPPFDFQPYATCWFATNHMPHTRDFSDALFRRALIIPFNRVFAEHEQDKRLKEKLVAELPGILNLALEAMGTVFERGDFTRPKSCEDARRAWRVECDQVAQFAEEQCFFDSSASIPSSKIYRAYEQWAVGAGINKRLNRKNFTNRITLLGANCGRGTGGIRLLCGVSLKI